MKGFLLAAFFIAATVFNSNAQIRIALVAGGHQSDIIEENGLPGFESMKQYYDKRTGLHLGFIADMPIGAGGKFYFQPGVIYQQRGRKFLYSQDSTVVIPRFPLPDSIANTTYIENRRQYINYIDLPLNLVYKFPIGKKVKFIIGAGPYLSIFYSGSDKRQKNLVGIDFENEDDLDPAVGKGPGKYNVINYGVNGSAGFEFGRIFLTANYSRGLNDHYQAVDHDGGFKHQSIGATIGIFLGKITPPEPKIMDKDGDGIVDAADACPDNAGPAITNGCPDKDSDGIADREDSCPAVAGIRELKGCPVTDQDKDGVNDNIDKCPAVPGLSKYEGCPIPDTDSDGTNDETDKCPTVAGLTRYEGCPIPDRDADGVNDEEDNCPDQKGLSANKGCPEIEKTIVDKVNYAAKMIRFAFAKSTLEPSSFKELDEVVKILTQNAGLKLSIEGHTSTDGIYEANMKLSQERAERVKAYLVSKGIAAERLTAEGFGPNKPLNKDASETEKAKNRRVELRISN